MDKIVKYHSEEDGFDSRSGRGYFLVFLGGIVLYNTQIDVNQRHKKSSINNKTVKGKFQWKRRARNNKNEAEE